MSSTDHGTVYAAGSNVNAQLGLGNQSPNVSKPARVCDCRLLVTFCLLTCSTVMDIFCRFDTVTLFK